MRQAILTSTLMLAIACTSGCSSLGFSLWPSQFPLLRATKNLASQSPMPPGVPTELSKRPIETYFLEPGDRVLIEPVNLDSKFRTIGDQEVQLDGSIDLGKFGRLRVAGLAVEEVEIAIEDSVLNVAGEAVPINVQLLEANAAEVYVLGEVGSPGVYSIDGHETVLDVILTAGGLTSQASPCDIVLVRPTAHCDKRIVLPVCYRQLTQIGDTTSNYQIQPGDRVVVGARTLCEELAIWRQACACPRCNCKHTIECHPASKGYVNRFVGWLNPFPRPRALDSIMPVDTDTTKVDSTEEDTSAESSSRTQAPIETLPASQDADADADLFLPPIPSSQSTRESRLPS